MDTPIMTPALAARLEAAEATYYESRLQAIRAIDGNPMGAETNRFGADAHVLARYAKHNPVLNRVECLAAGDESILDDLLAWYAERGGPCRVVVCPFTSSAALLQALASRDFMAVGFNTVLCGVPTAMTAPPMIPAQYSEPSEEVTVEQLSAQHLSALVEVIADSNGWNAPDVKPGLRMYYKLVTARQYQGPDHADWRCYVARVDGQAAASAALHVRDGLGSLTADGTHPAYRGRGCQTALIVRRIADAAAAGCELVVTQTAPGSTSQRNMERAGFRTAYTRTFWERRR